MSSTQEQLTNLDQSYQQALKRNEELEHSLEELQPQHPDSRLEEALNSEKSGDHSKAKQLFSDVVEKGEELNVTFGEAPYQMGIIAESEIKYQEAYEFPYTFFCFVTDIITPFFFFFSLTEANYHRYALVQTLFEIEPLLLTLFLVLVLSIVSVGLKQYSHLKRNIGDLVCLPVYAIVVAFFLTPLRVIAFMTMADSKWHTR